MLVRDELKGYESVLKQTDRTAAGCLADSLDPSAGSTVASSAHNDAMKRLLLLTLLACACRCRDKFGGVGEP